VRLGILQRHVIGQILRAFLMALVAITAIFVLFMVMAEATRQGLAPQDVLRVVPYVIPGTLPYTVPVALLFAVTVVFGRMAGDNEIVAMKSAGLGAMFVLGPALALALALSVALNALGGDVIPRANHALKKVLFRDLEDMFYKVLSRDRQFDLPGWPFFIRVGRVEGRTLVDATFRHRVSRERPDEFDLTIQAKRARIEFDTEGQKARIWLDDAHIEGAGDRSFILETNGRQRLEYPIPERSVLKLDKKIQEMTSAELSLGVGENRQRLEKERPRQAVLAAMMVASGRVGRVDWRVLGEGYGPRQALYWAREIDKFETERHLRVALAFGAFCFVVLGAPVGILFARRDFLSAFISCFVPIIVLYYPLVLGGVNMAKEGIIRYEIVWAGNAVLLVLAVAFVIQPVRRH
jgi:lipopolysaccharide export system permease protein